MPFEGHNVIVSSHSESSFLRIIISYVALRDKLFPVMVTVLKTNDTLSENDKAISVLRISYE